MNRSPITTSSTRHSQQGAVLMVSLMILLMLTLIGVSAMQGSTLQEKMTGNLRDSSVAFQTAESALRDGEAFIESTAAVSAFSSTATNGTYGEFETPPDPFDPATWTNNNTSIDGTAVFGVSVTPRFFIRYTGTEDTTASLKLGQTYNTPPTGNTSTFSVTARGTGAVGGNSPVSEVLLRSYYGRKF